MSYSPQEWNTNYPPRGMKKHTTNYPPYQGQLKNRVEKAHDLDPTGNGSGYRPFWDFNQEFVDDTAIKWRVTTTVDGNLAGLYIQAPYGYQGDILLTEKSIILNRIIREMREQGHDDWADTVQKDQISDVSWLSGSCQAFGLSYSPEYKVDKVFLEGLASWDPYGVGVLHPELMGKLAPDEVVGGEPPENADAFLQMLSVGSKIAMVALIVIAISSGAGWTLFPACGLGISGGILDAKAKEKGKKNPKNRKPIGDRPGYVLKTTSGWVVLLLNASTYTSPSDLTKKALDELNESLASTNDPDADVNIVKTYTSNDGSMTFFQSDRPLQAECELSPYKAEQYLSLYARLQSPALHDRVYAKDAPTVIKGTTMLPPVRAEYAPSHAGNGYQGVSKWSPEAATARAESRMRGNPAMKAPAQDSASFMNSEKKRFIAIASELRSGGLPSSVADSILPRLDDLHKRIASIDAIMVNDVVTGKQEKNAVDAELTEIERMIQSSKVKTAEKSVADSLNVINADSMSSVPIPSPAPSPASDDDSLEMPMPSTGAQSPSASSPFGRIDTGEDGHGNEPSTGSMPDGMGSDGSDDDGLSQLINEIAKERTEKMGL